MQVGLRVSIWTNAPLSKDVAPAITGAVAVAEVTASGATIGTPTATNAPSIPHGEQEEQVSAIPAGSTIIPALEVGIVNQQLVCIGDPSLQDQWREAQIQERLGIAVPHLQLDASSVPVEAVMLVCSRFRSF